MGSSPIQALGNKLFANTVPIDSIIEKHKEEGQKASDEILEKIDLKENSRSEIAKLQSLVVKAKKAGANITDPLQTGFDSKTATVSSGELGQSGSDFLKNVRVDNKAIKGSTKIAVESVATESDLIIRSGAANTGFANNGDLQLNGTLTLNLAGTNIDITIAAGDDLSAVINKINTGIFAGNHEFEAFKIKGQNDTSFIEIKAMNTGAASSITFNYADNGGTDILNQQFLTNGTDAKIYVNGIEHQQASNKFSDIVPGTSFEIIKANSVINQANPVNFDNLNKTTISTSEDKSAIKKLIADFADTISEISYLVAKNKQSSQSIEDFKYADPTTDFGSFDSSDAPLRGSSLLKEAEDIITKMLMPRNHVGGDIKSLQNLGITTKEETNQGDNFSHERFTFSDKETFEKAFEYSFDDVYNFFVTNAKVTPNVGNQAYIQYLPSETAEAITDSSIIGKDLDLAVTYDNGGAVTKVAVNVNGKEITAKIEHNQLTGRYNADFISENNDKNPLEGLSFSIDPNGAVNTIENSTIRYNPGLVNELNTDLRSILSDDGQKGSSIEEAGKIKHLIDSDRKELERVEKELQKSLEETKKIESTLHFMEQQTNMLLASLEAVLLGDN